MDHLRHQPTEDKWADASDDLREGACLRHVLVRHRWNLHGSLADLELFVAEVSDQAELSAEHLDVAVEGVEPRQVAVLNSRDPTGADSHGIGDLLLRDSLASAHIGEVVRANTGEHPAGPLGHLIRPCCRRMPGSDISPLLRSHPFASSSIARSASCRCEPMSAAARSYGQSSTPSVRCNPHAIDTARPES